jgi:hypothetical protein
MEDAMFRFASLSLAALASFTAVTAASALTPQQLGNQKIQTPAQLLQNQQNKPNAQAKLYFNPNLKLAQPYKPVQPIPTPNPAFYPKIKPWYPKYYPVAQPVQTVIEPVYIASKTAKPSAPSAKSGADCLSKETTAEGLVIFRDTCTNEVAVTAIPGTPAGNAMEAQQAALAQMSGQQTAAAQTTGQPAEAAK